MTQFKGPAGMTHQRYGLTSGLLNRYASVNPAYNSGSEDPPIRAAGFCAGVSVCAGGAAGDAGRDSRSRGGSAQTGGTRAGGSAATPERSWAAVKSAGALLQRRDRRRKNRFANAASRNSRSPWMAGAGSAKPRAAADHDS